MNGNKKTKFVNKSLRLPHPPNDREALIKFLIENQILPYWSGEGVFFKPQFINMNEKRAKECAKILGVSNREECAKLRKQIRECFFFSKKEIKEIFKE